MLTIQLRPNVTCEQFADAIQLLVNGQPVTSIPLDEFERLFEIEREWPKCFRSAHGKYYALFFDGNSTAVVFHHCGEKHEHQDSFAIVGTPYCKTVIQDYWQPCPPPEWAEEAEHSRTRRS